MGWVLTFRGSSRIMALFLFLLFSLSGVSADDDYKPYLHNAEVPEHPKVRLYGTYSTSLFPGAAAYSYQIDVPPGSNGLQPRVVVSYNSQNVKQRPGVLGAGWGLVSSYIFRDVNGTVGNVSDDVFKLVFNDAVHELVYDGSGAFYRTKVDSYMRVENLSGGSNAFGMYWLVTSREGVKYRFGFYDGSELASNMGWNYSLRWSLDEVEDAYGNNVSYVYVEDPHAEDNGSVYLSRILYNGGQSRVVDFVYEVSVRPDRRRVFEQGNSLEESRRLVGVNVSAGGSLVRRYSFDYVDLNPEKSLTSVSRISFFGSDGVSELHNAQFGYYNATPGFAKLNSSTEIGIPHIFYDFQRGDMGVRFEDVDLDGFVDLVKGSVYGNERKVWINNRTDPKKGWSDASAIWSFPVFFVDAYHDDMGVWLVDINGDGRADVVQNVLNASVEVKKVFINNGSGWVNSSSWGLPFVFADNHGAAGLVVDKGARFADLNGDGLNDIIYAYKSDTYGENKTVYLNNGSGWNKTNKWAPPNFFVFDDRDAGMRLVDLNGDGLVDLLRSANVSGYHDGGVWLNTGDGWANGSSGWEVPFAFHFLGDMGDVGVRFADANGDGLVDLWNGAEVFLNNGSGWVKSGAWASPEQFVVDGKNIGRRIADVNGDGLADILVSYENSSSSVRFAWVKNGTVPYVLKSVKAELGANITIGYQNSTYFDNLNGTGFYGFGFNVLVVDSVVQNNSVGGSLNAVSNRSYAYSGGLYDYRDREFRGFSQVSEIMPDGGVVKHYFHQDSARKGLENRTDVYGSSGNLYSKTENTYNFTQSSGVYENFLTSTAAYVYDGAAANPKVTRIEYAYDDYGNAVTKYSLGDVSFAGDEKLERYDYVYNATANILNTPSRYRLFAADNVTRVRDTKYIHDNGIFGSSPSRGSVTAVEKWLDSGEHYREENMYGSSGELLSQIDALGRTTKYRYDSTKTFVEQIINPLGHVTRFNYDSGTGNLLWSEKNGIRTSFEYDFFGRVVKEVQPYDVSYMPTKSYTYSFDGTAPESIKVSQRTTANKTLDAYYFYDGFGNVVQIKTPSYDNKQAVKNFVYDGSGRVKAVQSPYFDAFSTGISAVSSTTAFTNYSYDSLGRVTNVTNPDATVARVVFDRQLISTYDENGHRKDYWLDAYDRIVRVQEYNIDSVLGDGVVHGFNTTYAYDVTGQLVQVNDTYGNQFGFVYDSLGRRTKLSDPDVGEWNYTYDLTNNLISQAGGGGNLVSGDGFYREYNSLNQLVLIRNGSSGSSPLLEQYYYDPFNERVKVWRNDTAGTVVYTPFREFMQVRNSSGIYNYTYVYDGSTLVARVNPDQSVHYYHPDHLGSTTLITDQSGNVVEETFYEPFGAVTSGGTADVKLYTGQFSDEATGQYYYGARYYLPGIGRFGQADSVIQSLYDPQLFNRYTYTRNNPHKYVDSGGNIIDCVAGCPVTASVVAYIAIAAGTAVVGSFVISETLFANEAEIMNDAPYPTFPIELPPSQAVIENTYKDVLFKEGTITEFPSFEIYKLPLELPTINDEEEKLPLLTDPEARKEKISKQDSRIWEEIYDNSEPIKSNEQYRKMGDYAYRWDNTHRDIEMYKFKGGNKLEEVGSLDPKTGNLYREPKNKRVVKVK